MQPLFKSYLLNHTFQQLEDEHGVCARPSADGTKYSLNYDQLLAKSGDPVAEQCRGAVVRPLAFQRLKDSADWKQEVVGHVEVLAWPMSRFYNFGDSAAADIDWSHPSLKVYEKVDGTCIILYWDTLKNAWHCATRSVPEADLPINAGNLEIGDTTFAQLFLKALIATREEVSGKKVEWAYCDLCGVGVHEAAHPHLPCPTDDKTPHTWKVDGPDKVIHLNQELTYVFELVSPYNQIVVNYPQPRVYLLAARHTQTGKELPIETLRLQHVLRPKTWEIRDVASLSCFVDAANPAELEGAVVCVQVGDSFAREKVKNKSYVIAHKSKDTVTASERNALEAVILEKADDIIPLVPVAVQDKLRALQDKYAKFCKNTDETFVQLSTQAAGNRKEFALSVQSSGAYQPPLFRMWEKRANSCRDWVRALASAGKLSDSTLDSILGRLQ